MSHFTPEQIKKIEDAFESAYNKLVENCGREKVEAFFGVDREWSYEPPQDLEPQPHEWIDLTVEEVDEVIEATYGKSPEPFVTSVRHDFAHAMIRKFKEKNGG